MHPTRNTHNAAGNGGGHNSSSSSEDNNGNGHHHTLRVSSAAAARRSAASQRRSEAVGRASMGAPPTGLFGSFSGHTAARGGDYSGAGGGGRGTYTGSSPSGTGAFSGTDGDGVASSSSSPPLSNGSSYHKYNPIGIVVGMYADTRAFMAGLIEGFGGKFIAMLAIVYFCMKGLSNNATSAAMLPFYKKSLNIPSTEYQKYFNVANMAFSIKPLIGLLSDLLPIGGYSKRYYIALIALMSSGSLVTIALWASGEGQSAAGPITAALFFVFFVGIAGSDLLMEGKYSELMNTKRAPTSVITFVWLCFSVGALAGALLEGPMADLVKAEIILLVAAPFAAFPAIFALLGWIPEKRKKSNYTYFGCLPCCSGGGDGDGQQEALPPPTSPLETLLPTATPTTSDDDPKKKTKSSPTESNGGSYGSNDNTSMATAATVDPSSPTARSSLATGGADDDEDEDVKSWAAAGDPRWLAALRTPNGLIALGVGTAMCSVTMALISLLSSDNMTLLYFIAPAAFVLLVASFMILPRAAAYANLFMFLRELFYLQMTGPLDYFYTATPQCLADGPHFSYSYYQTLVSFLGAGGTMLGTILFQRYLSRMTFMRVFFVSTTLKILASGFDLIITKRWNVHYLGLSDELMFLCGDAIIYPICTMLDFMPTTVLLSRLCPRGMESTMFALLASFNNFGASISRAIGYIVADHMGIRTMGNDDCDFENLWLLVVLGHMLLPCAIFFFSWAFMPDTPMTSTIVHSSHPDADANGAADVNSTTAGGGGDYKTYENGADVEIATRPRFVADDTDYLATAAADGDEESSDPNRKPVAPLYSPVSTPAEGPSGANNRREVTDD